MTKDLKDTVEKMGTFLESLPLATEVKAFLQVKSEQYPDAGYPRVLLDLLTAKLQIHQQFKEGSEDYTHATAAVATAATLYAHLSGVDGKGMSEDLRWLEDKVFEASKQLKEAFPDDAEAAAAAAVQWHEERKSKDREGEGLGVGEGSPESEL